jgi:hypothetical protein
VPARARFENSHQSATVNRPVIDFSVSGVSYGRVCFAPGMMAGTRFIASASGSEAELIIGSARCSLSALSETQPKRSFWKHRGLLSGRKNEVLNSPELLFEDTKRLEQAEP